jgi:hypothetical protein
MKVKMFVNVGHVSELEKEVNEWLNNNLVNILHIKQSSAFNNLDHPGSLDTVISLWYE